ncbi:MCE family protein [Arthrobacter sp. SLBN-53]|uniref:MlaD family protein n=1 Tax=Arthrobacter sp. SLBN-53 TaxID=2768412 RepID=UPI0011541353|nr:MCE family protein [Arthrobacter sp. SLBN-53]TQK32061.1 virulence factor Mce-like protein [Arthrobacter sp. SLBN-53]
MPNPLDPDPRASSQQRLAVLGACSIVIVVCAAVLMVAQSRGLLDDFVRVRIDLTDIGDGLPVRSDVKFRGVLVGMVTAVTASPDGRGPNTVEVFLDPEYANHIPSSVTARVVPANLFAVSAVQLVDHDGELGTLRDGSVIREDRTLPTVLFQNVLAKLREVVNAAAQAPNGDDVGALTALTQATQGRGDKIIAAAGGLNRIVTQLNAQMAGPTSGEGTLSTLRDAADVLRAAAPELSETLDASLQPMRTLAEQRSALAEFLSGGLTTTSTIADALDHQSDRMITISTQLSPALGVIAEHADQFHGVATRLQTLGNKFYDEAWDPATNLVTIKAAVGFAPTRTYVRADCPRYGQLAGPSCQTAPEVPTAPDLLPALDSMGLPAPPGVPENRPNLAPPRDSIDQGPPAASPAQPPAPTEAGPAQPAAFGGTVGPVGSDDERAQLSRIIGGPATSVTQLLLGPITRGATVEVTPAGGVR